MFGTFGLTGASWAPPACWAASWRWCSCCCCPGPGNITSGISIYSFLIVLTQIHTNEEQVCILLFWISVIIWRILVRLLRRIRDTYLFWISVACFFLCLCSELCMLKFACLLVCTVCCVLFCASLWVTDPMSSQRLAQYSGSTPLFSIHGNISIHRNYYIRLGFFTNLLNFKCFGVVLQRHEQAWVSATHILTFLHVDCSKKLLLNFSLFPNYYFAFLPRVYINGAFQNLFEHKEKRNLVYHQISLKRVGKGKLCTRELRLEIYLCLKIFKFCQLVLISGVAAEQFDSRSIIFSYLRLDWRWCVSWDLWDFD